MATRNLPSYEKGTVLRLANQTEAAEASFTLYIPDGSPVVGNGEIYKVVRLGEQHTVLSVSIEVSSSLAASGLTFDAGTDLVADCFIDGAALGNGAGGMVAKIGGLETANTFADGYIAASNAKRDLQFTILGAPGTPVTAGVRWITYRVTYGRHLPDTIVAGVTDQTYPFAGSQIVLPGEEFTYNGNAP